jgi:hypothetical protein
MSFRLKISSWRELITPPTLRISTSFVRSIFSLTFNYIVFAIEVIKVLNPFFLCSLGCKADLHVQNQPVSIHTLIPLRMAYENLSNTQIKKCHALLYVSFLKVIK